FCAANGIKHTLTPPLHLRSNGTVERQVAKVKRSLEKQLSTKKLTAEKIQFSLDNFLLKHRITPNSVTGYAPAEFLLKRIARTKLDLLKPTKYKRTHDTLKEMSSTDKMFVEGEEVLVWNKRNNDKKWITGKIAKQVNPFTYLVNVNCELRFVHAEDLKVNQPPTWRFPVCPLPTRKDKVEATPNGTLPQTKTDVSESIPTSRTPIPILSPSAQPQVLCRSIRDIKPPQRLNL
ncbi:hypothetical protein QE152_g40791, partial [Popillia japonica]